MGLSFNTFIYFYIFVLLKEEKFKCNLIITLVYFTNRISFLQPKFLLPYFPKRLSINRQEEIRTD